MSKKCIHPGPHHSDDVVEVWHGQPTPAIGCGFHAHNYGPELAAAHNAALGVSG